MQPNLKQHGTKRAGVVSVAACVGIVAWTCAEGSAAAQIKSPGAHPHYGVEVEPHVVLQWGDHPWGHSKDGWGLGARATIPIIEDGPIGKINNSMGIGFGLDWAHFSDYCWDYWYRGDPVNSPYANEKCTANTLWFPVVLQWNFWIHKSISVFAEPGLAIVHRSWDVWWHDGGCAAGWCKRADSETTVEPLLLFGGARFHINDRSAVTLRIGWPYLSLGASLFF